MAQLCLTFCDPMDCSPPGPSVHEILQARILEWVAMPSSRGSFQLTDQTQVSCFLHCRQIIYRLRLVEALNSVTLVYIKEKDTDTDTNTQTQTQR